MEKEIVFKKNPTSDFSKVNFNKENFTVGSLNKRIILNDYLYKISCSASQIVESYLEIANAFRKIDELELYKLDGYKSSLDLIFANFKMFSKTLATNLLNIGKKMLTDVDDEKTVKVYSSSFRLKKEFVGLNWSQMIELLPVSDDLELVSKVKKFPVNDIRYVKSLIEDKNYKDADKVVINFVIDKFCDEFISKLLKKLVGFELALKEVTVDHNYEIIVKNDINKYEINFKYDYYFTNHDEFVEYKFLVKSKSMKNSMYFYTTDCHVNDKELDDFIEELEKCVFVKKQKKIERDLTKEIMKKTDTPVINSVAFYVGKILNPNYWIKAGKLLNYNLYLIRESFFLQNQKYECMLMITNENIDDVERFNIKNAHLINFPGILSSDINIDELLFCHLTAVTNWAESLVYADKINQEMYISSEIKKYEDGQ